MKPILAAIAASAALALACAANPPAGHADDQAPPRPETKPGPREEEAHGLVAVVEDQYGIRVELTDLSFELAGSSLIGGGRAKKLAALEYWIGAFRQKVEVADLLKVEVTGKPEGDLVPVRITRRSGKVVEGKIERTLEVRGKVDGAATAIQFERLKSLTMRQ